MSTTDQTLALVVVFFARNQHNRLLIPDELTQKEQNHWTAFPHYLLTSQIFVNCTQPGKDAAK